MAFTYSRYLRLKLDSNLTASARYNLERIDLLGSVVSLDTTSSVNLRSRFNINIEPESQIAGGSGIGGVVNIGSGGHEISELNIFAADINFSDPDAVIGSLLPDQTNNAGKVLQTDGSVLSWTSVSGTGSVQSSETNWLTSDGTTKIFAHNLSSSDIVVSIIDLDTNEIVAVDSIIATTDNVVTMSASESPGSSWRVVVHAN